MLRALSMSLGVAAPFHSVLSEGIPYVFSATWRIASDMSAFASIAVSTASKVLVKLNGGEERRDIWADGSE